MKTQQLLSKLKFWIFIASTYLEAKNKSGKSKMIFMTLFLGISLGLMVLIVVLGIMNGFQDNHISRKIEIGSYHISIKKHDNKPFSMEETYRLKKELYDTFSEIEAVVPYTDRDIMLRLNNEYYNEDQVIKLRAVDPDEINKDSRFKKYFQLNFGDLDLPEYSIIIGEALYHRIAARTGKKVFLTPDISLASLKNKGIPFTITDAFNTGSYDYDRFWGFISIYSLIPLSGKAQIDCIGLKLVNKKHDKKFIKILNKHLGDTYKLQTAYEVNQGYFTALRLEKVIIIMLFLIILIMVAANTFGAIKLTIIEKKTDISILKAIGASPFDIEVIYVIESLLLGFTGSFTGVTLGMLVSYNISNIFIFVEFIINNLLSFVQYMLGNALPGLYFEEVKIYDFSIYYQSTFPVKIYLNEVIIICFAIILMSVLAAFIPVSRASRLKPNEIIKN